MSTALIIKPNYIDKAFNDGFYQKTVTSLQEQGIRVIQETADSAEAVNRIISLWQDNPVQYLFVMGHGDGDSVMITSSEDFSVKNINVEVWKKAVAQDGTIAYFSCNDGKAGGLAQETSKLIHNVHTVGSRIVLFTDKVLITQEGLRFFHWDGKNFLDVTASYLNGVNQLPEADFSDMVFQTAFESRINANKRRINPDQLQQLAFRAKVMDGVKADLERLQVQPKEEESAPIEELSDYSSNEEGYSSGEEFGARPALQRKGKDFDLTVEAITEKRLRSKRPALQRREADFDLVAPAAKPAESNEKSKKPGIFNRVFGGRKKAKA
jgi:hypothetical protein